MECVRFIALVCVLLVQTAHGTIAEQSPELTTLDIPAINKEDTGFEAWLQYIHDTSDAGEKDLFYEGERSVDSGSDDQQGMKTDDNEESDSSDLNKLEVTRTIVVAKDGSGDFRTVQESINHVPTKNKERTEIHIKAGFYRERVRIPKSKPYITLQGDKGARAIISYNSTASDRSKTHGTLKTYESATVAVDSKFFIARDITFENTAPRPSPGAMGKQAVAFRISADNAAFYNCKFSGKQDTLYDHHGRHYFKNCYIEGTVDFVFGNGRSLYKNCVLNTIDNSGSPGSLTAQKRNETTLDTGFSFVDSHVSGSGQVYLGRAWGNESRVVFAYSYMDDVVIPVGWNNWGLPQREKTAYYAEYQCYGPGAVTKQRAKWARVLSADEARPFLSTAFINGKDWLPKN